MIRFRFLSSGRGGAIRVGLSFVTAAVGAIRTDSLQADIDAAPDPSRAERSLAALHPLGYLGQARAVPGAVALLLSDRASFTSGQSIGADGGASVPVYLYQARQPSRGAGGHDGS